MKNSQRKIGKVGPLRLGELVWRVPDTFGPDFYRSKEGGNMAKRKPICGVVVYIHPRGRFHMVEFAGRSGAAREAFFGVDR